MDRIRRRRRSRHHRHFVFLTAALALGCLLTTPAPWASASDDTVFWADNSDDSVDLGGQRDTSSQSVKVVHAGSKGPRRQVMVVPACVGNEPTAGARDAMCTLAASLCAGTPDPDDVMFWIYTGPAAAAVARPTPAQWVRAGQRCMSPQAAGELPALPQFTVRDFRRLPLPPGGVNVQPPNLRTLVNIPTNLYVQADTTTIDTTLLGLPVQVRATPQEFTWTFGDGQHLTTTDKGAPYPDLRTTHTYTTPGTTRLALTTTYTGQYSIAGRAWLPIDGTAQVTSTPLTLTILEARTQLVAGNP